jgi:hypothetical protein
MSRLIILIAVALAAWLLMRWFVSTPPKQVIATVKRTGLTLGLAVLALLVVTGRLNWIVAAGAAALPFLKKGFVLLRYLPMVQGLFGGTAKAANFGGRRNPFSTLETRFLRVSLDITTGNLDGEVLEGAFEGEFLSKMSRDKLLTLLGVCNSEDPRSAALLTAYLDRHHTGWRAQTGHGGQREQTHDYGQSGNMSPAEARDILGIDADASENDILQAHRRLIHKLHPDRGGSTYLAAKINQAKDCLLKR